LSWNSAGDLDENVENVRVLLGNTVVFGACLWCLEGSEVGVEGRECGGLDLEEFSTIYLECFLKNRFGVVDNSFHFLKFFDQSSKGLSFLSSISNEFLLSHCPLSKFLDFEGNICTEIFQNWSINLNEGCLPLLLDNSGVNVLGKLTVISFTCVSNHIVVIFKIISLVSELKLDLFEHVYDKGDLFWGSGSEVNLHEFQ